MSHNVEGPRARSGALLVTILVVLNLGLLAWIAFAGRVGAGAPAATPERGAASTPEAAPVAEPHPVAPAGPLAPDEQRVVSLFEQLSPSVAYITTLGRVRSRFDFNVHRVPQGSGSGFVWDSQGHIVTNFHVIRGASDAVVTLADGSEHPASLVGVAPDHDLAVLKIDVAPGQLRPLPVGTSRDLRVGQFVMAIGNPFGLDQTLTTGVVSALDREIESVTGRQIYGVIQTDAAINPGNSGGPLIDSSGRLIGVNTAIQSPSGASAGIGFAVPVDTVNRIVPQLIRYGKAKRPGLGVSLLGPAMSRRFGVEGVVIREVFRGSPAADAGLVGLSWGRRGSVRLGDVIVGVDDDEVREVSDLLKVIDQHDVGDEIVLKLARDGALREVKVRLAALD